jgi:hypothetical protein
MYREFAMAKLILALGAALLAPAAPLSVAAAQPLQTMASPATTTPPAAQRTYQKRYSYREWRGSDGRLYCRRPDGTTGTVLPRSREKGARRCR